MSRRSVLGLAVLLVLAGCQGGTLPDAGSQIGEPGSTATPDLAGFSYPTGASADGLDPETLPTRHVDALRESHRYTLEQYTRSGNQTSTARLHVDQDRRRLVGARQRNGTHEADFYATEDKLYQRSPGEELTGGSQFVRYQQRSQNWSQAGATGQLYLEDALETYRFEAEHVTVRNGTPVVVYRSIEPRGSGNTGAIRVSENASATLALDARGIVRELEFRSKDGKTVGFRVSNVTTAGVRRPEWVDSVPGVSPIQTPNVTLSATTHTVELETANRSLETTAVSIQHEGGEPLNTSALDVTVHRNRAYGLRELSTSNDSLTPVQPFDGVGETFEEGESVRIIHTIPPELYGGAVTIDDGTLAVGDRSGSRTFPRLEEERSIVAGDVLRVLWNRSNPQTLYTYTVEPPTSNRSVTDGN